MLLKEHKNKIYGLNLSRLENLYKTFGLKLKKYKNNTNEIKRLEMDIDTFLKINLIKKEYMLKIITLNKLKKIETGSYKGYLMFRGLPSKNQRTKTNSRTARRISK